MEVLHRVLQRVGHSNAMREMWGAVKLTRGARAVKLTHGRS